MALGWKGQYTRYRQVFLNILTLYQKREDLRMFLEILLSLATISLFGIFALRPTFLTIAYLYKEITNKEEAIVKMDNKIEALESAQIILRNESQLISILESGIPSLTKPDIFAYQIESLAATNSVKISGFTLGETIIKGKPSPEKKAKEPSPLPSGAWGTDFSLSVTGNYQSLLSFFENLERLRIPVKVDAWGINLSKSQEATILTLTISGRIPCLGEAK